MTTENKTTSSVLRNFFSDGSEPRVPPKLTVTSDTPLTTDEAARVAEALEADGFSWVIEGATVDPIGVSDNVARRSKSTPRVKRGG
ncbi:hypothetical protein pEaSNUABM11_00156 [Erwinia phage pEa_SNUABM_11]|nr:hypothetical protein pEaSNUABM11_00156 [Erwinia phage pEa_SNUABM_11]